jgi:SSS family solute:Na+ symporter
MIVVSYMTKEPDYAALKNLTFGTRTNEHLADSHASWDWRDIAISILVVAVIIGGYVYFTG